MLKHESLRHSSDYGIYIIVYLLITIKYLVYVHKIKTIQNAIK